MFLLPFAQTYKCVDAGAGWDVFASTRSGPVDRDGTVTGFVSRLTVAYKRTGTG